MARSTRCEVITFHHAKINVSNPAKDVPPETDEVVEGSQEGEEALMSNVNREDSGNTTQADSTFDQVADSVEQQGGEATDGSCLNRTPHRTWSTCGTSSAVRDFRDAMGTVPDSLKKMIGMSPYSEPDWSR